MRGSPVIAVDSVTKRYDGLTVLNSISLAVHEGQVAVLIGASGGGKSTLLKCINMLEPPESGKIYVEGADITAKRADLRQLRARLGIVFQDYNLFPHMTVLGNLTLAPIRVSRLSKDEARTRAEEELRRVGLEGKINAWPSQLSGGQRQRVAIARALAMRPTALLLDEITSALDPESVADVLSVVRELAAQGATMLIVTHHMGFAREVADRVMFIDGGSILEEGTPTEVFDESKEERTRNFLRRVRFA
ncbi:MAG: amino acid ABC transporter ATP-binding protein [Actinomycetota bacterium]|nr:amino acid ABC transporter ATP-binding protein [Actinomycetota bacterium]MDA8399626.1 amino acid ABC transporter ATP-binding protein [Actinomycetota bacterium]